MIARSQKHRQRPAARSLRNQLMRHLVDLVEVWSFFAIDFDVDEQPVHDVGRARILERFVGHDMAPVAGRISE